ncbi:hypothetical protein GCM10012284_49400 [Mangrovihabitans endophyticus]|uniref:Uncharacterized protein n=1 Tax=Mangrovihabitans endophyticus TaxID=1751298 RepID=A0A8J3FR61_9ACTN|nr:hypothetical protein GCM10012284_49400 [Mangrovihabitans endophyticus]
MRGADEVPEKVADIEVIAGGGPAEGFAGHFCREAGHPAEGIKVVLPLPRQGHAITIGPASALCREHARGWEY